MDEPIVEVRLLLSEARTLLKAARSTDITWEARHTLFPRRRDRLACSRAENRLGTAIEVALAEVKEQRLRRR